MRNARCAYYSTCGAVAPTMPGLAFLEDLSDPAKLDGCVAPGTNALGQCGYTAGAHALAKEGARHLRRIAAHDFVQATEGQEHDRFYCGCKGWD